MKRDKIIQLQQQFQEKYGIDLETEITQLDANLRIVAFFNRAKDVLIEEIKSKNPSFDESELTKLQQDILDKALLEQAYYTFMNYDFTVMAGYDLTTNTFTPIEEIRKRLISPLARKILINGGFSFAGLHTGEIIDRDYRRRGWWF